MSDPEREGWRDLSDREMLSYAWSVLSKAEAILPHSEVVWAEVATAVGHLGRRLSAPVVASMVASPDDSPRSTHEMGS